MHNALRDKIDSFFFSPTHPQYLGVCRILFFGYLSIWFLNYDFSVLARHPEELWYPVIFMQIFQVDQFPSELLLRIAAPIWCLSMFSACIGLFTRTSVFVSVGLGLYLLGVTHSFAKINHGDAGLLFAMGIFLFSRAGDVYSVDRWLQKSAGQSVEPSGEYLWPIQMIRIVLVLIFFLAGLSKVFGSGLDWVTSEHFSTILVRTQLTREVALPIGSWIASMPSIAMFMAAGALVCELSAPLALFNTWFRRLIIPSLFLMQVGIRLVMGDDFTQFMALYLFWIPWLSMWEFARRFVFLNRLDKVAPNRNGPGFPGPILPASRDRFYRDNRLRNYLKRE